VSLLRRNSVSKTKLAIIGGTGDLGMGLAVRLSKHYEVLIGSREEAKAQKSAEQVRVISGGSVLGCTNDDAAGACDVGILAIPDLPTTEMLRDLAPSLRGKLVISPIVPMKFQDGVFSYTLREGSAAEKVASAIEARVASALHTIPAEKLLKHDQALELDVLVAADSRETFMEAAELISKIERLRPLHAGPLGVSRMVESMTPLLLNVGRFSKIRSPSIRIV
jgi:NADPH-dependent F420 reductase